jgi:subtilase family serine protease
VTICFAARSRLAAWAVWAALAPLLVSAAPAAPLTDRPYAAQAGEHTGPTLPDRLADEDANPVLRRPISTAACRRLLGRACYQPAQYHAAYDLNPLYRAGVTGAGRTVVLVDSFGSPTIQHDLEVYDRRFHLPDTSVRVLRWGQVPPFNPRNPLMLAWAGESTLDVEAVHAIAPGANIVLIETGVAETEGVVGVPEMMSAVNHLVDSGVGDVVSMSWATSEGQFPGFAQGDYASLTTLRYAFANARRHGVTLVASSGDGGGHANRLDAAWPAGDPLVTSVGGTQLRLNRAGRRLRPDRVWSGSGGERSRVFARPGFQDGVADVVGEHRGSPDVSMAGSPDGALWVYGSFDPAHRGWTASGAGTSESAPLFAAVVALADQAAGRRLGQIDDLLYQAYRDRLPGLVDVTSGRTGPHGFTAGQGYDLATGLGTVDAALLVRTLADLAERRTGS